MNTTAAVVVRGRPTTFENVFVIKIKSGIYFGGEGILRVVAELVRRNTNRRRVVSCFFGSIVFVVFVVFFVDIAFHDFRIESMSCFAFGPVMTFVAFIAVVAGFVVTIAFGLRGARRLAKGTILNNGPQKS